MRTIKFRAWDKKKNEWLKPIGASIAFPYAMAVSSPWDYTKALFGISSEDHEWMLSFAKDSRDIDIFEGDIIVHSANKEAYPVAVRFFDGAFRADGTQYQTVIDDFYASHCRVIGNIYENPELLKKGGE